MDSTIGRGPHKNHVRSVHASLATCALVGRDKVPYGVVRYEVSMGVRVRPLGASMTVVCSLCGEGVKPRLRLMWLLRRTITSSCLRREN